MDFVEASLDDMRKRHTWTQAAYFLFSLLFLVMVVVDLFITRIYVSLLLWLGVSVLMATGWYATEKIIMCFKAGGRKK